MISLFTLITMLVLLAIVVIAIATLINKKSNSDREKTSPFECGFDPFSSTRIPFSLRFFMITIIFLIFDVEIAIILPIPLILGLIPLTSWAFISFVFFLTLVLGLIHEWNFGSLDWTH